MIELCMICPAAAVDGARAICVERWGPAGNGMFTSAYSPTGEAPATHYVSNGPVGNRIAETLGDYLLEHEGIASEEPGLVVIAEAGLLPVSE